MAFTIEDGVLWKYTEEQGVTDIVIPKGVTRIENWAFWGCKSLRSVHIPVGVTKIGDGAFYGCESLISVIIPEGVMSVEKYAFAFCTSLIDVTVPESMPSIGIGAFLKTPWLEECPDDWVIINGILLKYKGTDAHVTIPKEVTSIGAGAFYEYQIMQSVTIPDTVTSIGMSAFGRCDHLAGLVIPDSVAWIGDLAFYKCRSIRLFGITFAPNEFMESDYTKARKMLETKDFTMKLNTDVKSAAVVGLWMKTADADAETFIKKSISRIMPFLIKNNNVNAVRKFLESGKFITKKNIDKYIACAIAQGRIEIQTELLHYKSETLGYRDPKTLFKL